MRLLDLNPLFPGPVDGNPQPGMATFFGGEWVFGDKALGTCRLDPQSTCPELWEDLTLDKTSTGDSRALLAVRDLRNRVGAPEGPWVALCPDGWSKASLQVFLGVAKECGLDVRVLVSRAVAVTCLAGATADMVRVLEWGWNDLRVVRVNRSDDHWTFEESLKMPGGGVIDMYRRDAALASERCLREFRLDPLDTGPLDQRLFNGWWKWRMRGEAWVFTHDHREVRLSENRSEFDRAQRDWWRDAGGEDAADQVAPSTLIDLLGLEDTRPEAEALGPVLGRFENPPPEGARWKGGLPAGNPARPSVPDAKPVTHVVIDGVAERIPESLDARPGETVDLPDGRRGLAIHVPEA